jgi:hypothetical protein
MKTYLRNNSLSICFLALFIGAFISQIVFGYKEYNKPFIEAGSTAIYLAAYLISGHFTEAAFQNWQNEFISIFAIIILSIYLKQIDS